MSFDLVDLENLMVDDDFAIIHDALNHHHFVLFKKQQDPSPRAQYELTERFDPASEEYGHDKTADNYIHGYFMGIPNQPQVQIKGHGFIKSFMGLQDIKLRHPHHSRTYSEVISEDQGDDAYTRFNRWNIDAGLYDLNPPKVTTLMAVQVPKCRRQTILYDDGYGEKLTAPLNMLSPEDQEFFRTSKAEYAPHPYNWVKPAKMHPTGLSVYTEGREKPESKLPPIDPSKIQILPMAWKNPVTGKLSLQVHPAPIRKIHCADGSIIDILKEVRDLMYRLQRPAISPQYVYAHDWEEGDMVLFNNHGVSHTVVGSLKPDDIRVFRQCNLAASEPPEGP
ncbi:hypothetical protein N7499_009063 [Penicillium canescens]|uniref:TauD/TfdA-like domain-containing protein n=1 Tax=Penicillium canescens TaxID=5083 RepID=A0AAD6NF43_PENCN|nr:uncharacterized protein N7446_008913 [Penicillium canescens]KAJ6032794.1 hypothetical protein N7444_010565 [Penicillium canescens]KAJ6058014.1 hypothetical protein N7460_001288 [Penicillium canescens]KAJ6059330.1 hypothetical protein N7446_008913 [Penicillium canescens]KAJ6071049.1 hypothetical protein N7499_009063 [Penicillium canescens]KAJ6169733.1 hypothetical protein N7485_007079 [Penicillium canescens]